MHEIVLASGAADPARGWGNMVGLLFGALGCYVVWRVDLELRRRGIVGTPPTPPAAATPDEIEKPQARAVSSRASRETSQEAAEPPIDDGDHWYGRIVQRGKDVYRVVGHVARTGNSPTDADLIDIPLDDEESDEEPLAIEPYRPPADGEEIDDESDEPIEAEPVVVQKETREQYAARLTRKGVDKPRIVAGLIEHYEVSRATAYRIVDAAAGTSRAA